MADDFNTIPEEVLQLAQSALAYFRDDGFEVEVEKLEFDYPFLPAFVGRREHTTLIVECATALDTDRLDRWSAYARSENTDTRIVFVVSEDEGYKPQTQKACRAKGGGLCCVDGNGEITELIAAPDLAVKLPMPDIKSFKPKLRGLLAAPYKKLAGGDWRDGAYEIFSIFEEKCKNYLLDGVASGAIITSTKKGRSYSVAEIDKATLGTMAQIFSHIQNANILEDQIGKTLQKINSSRVDLAHKRKSAAAEANVRSNAAKDLQASVNCLSRFPDSLL